MVSRSVREEVIAPIIVFPMIAAIMLCGASAFGFVVMLASDANAEMITGMGFIAYFSGIASWMLIKALMWATGFYDDNRC